MQKEPSQNISSKPVFDFGVTYLPAQKKLPCQPKYLKL